MIHRIDYHDDNGDLVDLDYCCSMPCMQARLATVDTNGGTFGAFPCGDETNYDVYCAHCSELMWHGAEEQEVER